MDSKSTYRMPARRRRIGPLTPQDTAVAMVICSQLIMAFVENISENPLGVICAASVLRTVLREMGDSKNGSLETEG